MLFGIVSLLVIFSSATSSDDPSVSWLLSAVNPKNEKHIIRDVFGSAKSGKIHAILGPSGSGKSTLLNTLAGIVQKGSLRINGQILTENKLESIYIQQEDILFAQLTTVETLKTSCELRSIQSKKDCKTVVNNMMNDLGLKKVQNTKVGDAKTKGLSGGEKKRLSIGNEIVLENASNSAYIFADEPTSGLDCFQAQNVVNLFKQLAAKGNTVIFSIHQPRASIYSLFDDITLLSEGRVIYSG
jgi:ABC-type multidrug transport system ATPase subunit